MEKICHNGKMCHKTCGFVDCGKKYPMLLRKTLNKMKKTCTFKRLFVKNLNPLLNNLYKNRES